MNSETIINHLADAVIQVTNNTDFTVSDEVWSEAQKRIMAYDSLVRACKAAAAYLIPPASVYKENRDEASRIINEALSRFA